MIDMGDMYKYWDSPYVLDAFCYTPEEFKIKSKQIGVVKDAVKQGILV